MWQIGRKIRNFTWNQGTVTEIMIQNVLATLENRLRLKYKQYGKPLGMQKCPKAYQFKPPVQCWLFSIVAQWGHHSPPMTERSTSAHNGRSTLDSPHPVEHYIHTTHTLIFTISGKTSHWVNSIHQGHNAAVIHRHIHRNHIHKLSKDINSSYEDVSIVYVCTRTIFSLWKVLFCTFKTDSNWKKTCH